MVVECLLEKCFAVVFFWPKQIVTLVSRKIDREQWSLPSSRGVSEFPADFPLNPSTQSNHIELALDFLRRRRRAAASSISMTWTKLKWDDHGDFGFNN